MKPAAAYLRCSSPGQATGDTFPRQCEATEDYADEHRLTVLAALPEPVSGRHVSDSFAPEVHYAMPLGTLG